MPTKEPKKTPKLPKELEIDTTVNSLAEGLTGDLAAFLDYKLVLESPTLREAAEELLRLRMVESIETIKDRIRSLRDASEAERLAKRIEQGQTTHESVDGAASMDFTDIF